MPDILYAHTHTGRPQGEWEPLAVHLAAVGDRAAGFAEPFGAESLARAAGMLHDVGKAGARFQAYLRGRAPSVDHSTAGAQLAHGRYGARLGKLLAYVVAGHHAGLADGVGGDLSTLDVRLKKRIEGYERWPEAVRLPNTLAPPVLAARVDRQGFQLAFFTRMLFSCLVDADFLETERFIQAADRELWPDLRSLKPGFDTAFTAKLAGAPATDVNRQRGRILAAVRSRATLRPGLFSLTVPTGGGKTLASLAFALDHANAHDLDRIVYVIPFTSVVEQTAEVFRQMLGNEPVLEHHSAFDPGQWRHGMTDEERRSGQERHRQAAENWAGPVVVTTAVQLFESLFAARPGRCRKLHHLARAVIVLDEAQTLPLHLLRPCVAALDELARNYGASVVLMTATQPTLAEPDLKGGLENVRELAPPGLDGEPAFLRVTVRHAGQLDDTALAGRLAAERQVLCIVNSRRHARELYQAIQGEAGACHLSTLMCAVHRRDALVAIRTRLQAGDPVRLVATSLIEAGVDISFPLVFRAEAGLDQIAQAAGRCNREGELDGLGRVEIFASADHAPAPEIEQRAAAGRAALRRFPDAPLGSAAIDGFFREIYLLKGEAALDRHQVLDRFAQGAGYLDFPFATIAEQFRLIESAMVPILIPYDDRARQLLAALEHVPFIGRTARALQPYTAQVPRQVRGLLVASGAARSLREADYPGQFVALDNLDLYRTDLGLTWDDPTFQAAERLVF